MSRFVSLSRVLLMGFCLHITLEKDAKSTMGQRASQRYQDKINQLTAELSSLKEQKANSQQQQEELTRLQAQLESEKQKSLEIESRRAEEARRADLERQRLETEKEEAIERTKKKAMESAKQDIVKKLFGAIPPDLTKTMDGPPDSPSDLLQHVIRAASAQPKNDAAEGPPDNATLLGQTIMRLGAAGVDVMDPTVMMGIMAVSRTDGFDAANPDSIEHADLKDISKKIIQSDPEMTELWARHRILLKQCVDQLEDFVAKHR